MKHDIHHHNMTMMTMIPGCPRVDGGASLAGSHVSHPALVPQVAHLRVVTSGRPVLQDIHIILVVTIIRKLFPNHVLHNPMSSEVCMEAAGLVGGLVLVSVQ